MAKRTENIADRQALADGNEANVRHTHLDGPGKFAFEIFVAVVLAVVAALLVDLALHSNRSDANRGLECAPAIELAADNGTAQSRSGSRALVDYAVLSCLVREMKRPDVRV